MFIEGKLGRSAPTKLQIYKPGHLLPVLPASNLLANARYQGVLQQIRTLNHLNPEHFALLYEAVVKRFAEFVQVLPSQSDGALRGMLNEGLARATLALQQFVEVEGKKADPLLAYAVFTAGLLMGVAKVVINQRIIMTDDEGNYIDDWRPYEGRMLGRGDYYRIYPRSKSLQRLDSAMTILLARQVMPKIGFSWLASDFDILSDWLDTLQNGGSAGGVVGLLFSKLRREDVFSLADSLAQSQIPVTMMESQATQHAEAFLDWLKNGLANQDIKVNTSDAGVHIVQEGVFLERNKIFKQFAEIYHASVNMNVVFSQFGNMFGINKKSGDFASEQYFSDYPETTAAGTVGFASPLAGRQRSMRDGIVLSDASVIFVNSQVPSVTKNLKSMHKNSEHQLPKLPQQKHKPKHTAS